MQAFDNTEQVFPLDMGPVVIQPGTSVGQVIATKQFSFVIQPTGSNQYGSYQQVEACTGGGTIHFDLAQNPASTTAQSVYATSVPGIGLKLTGIATAGPTPGSTSFPSVQAIPANTPGAAIYAGTFYQVDLVKTAATTGSGPLSSGVYARIYGDDGLNIMSLTVSGNSTTIVTPTCNVNAGSLNIPVNFKTVPVKNFSGPGSTASSQPFNIRLDCSAGVGVSNKVYLSFDGTPDPSGTPGVLQITQGQGTAKGVGIQLLDKSNAAVVFKQPMLVGPSFEGSYTVPFPARYYQTTGQVMPGVANGMATFNINDQ